MPADRSPPNPSTPPLQGLSGDEAARRLAAEGPNAIEDRERRGLARTLAGIAGEPMFLLLAVAAGLYLAVGDLGEGLLLAFFALVTIGLVIVQERRSERALQALRDLAAPQVRVLRDGRVQRVAADTLVVGDLFLLAEGERVAADGWVRDAVALTVDESVLTGESMPVRKRAADAPPADPRPGGDDTPQVYAGTLVVAGHALAEVTATGRRTQVGRIGASLASIETAPTPLQRQLRRLVQGFGLVALFGSITLALWYGLQRGDWLQGLLAAITLAMAMLPEEFPMVLTVFLALGAWRLARQQVLVRRPAVIEALGAATVLCVDKTGTLTENRMRLQRLVTGDLDCTVTPGAALPEGVHRLLEVAMLASRRGSADPIDRALLAHGDDALADTEHLHPQWLLEREYPLTPSLLAMSHAWTDEQGRRHVAAKGAPEAVADLCHLDAGATAKLLARAGQLAAQGLRVLAVAEGVAPGGPVAAEQHDYGFSWLGLVGFEDPLRPGVPEAVALARTAGIAVAMITGDHEATALAIARQAGIDTAPGALDGARIDALDDAALADAVRRVRVFARVLPQQKLRLVQALRRAGETVAMTGDGVNDAPALKAAHIGIAIGARGTDVAREAASLVLLDEDFGRIVGGVRMGRRIADQLRRVMVYVTAIHVPVAGLSLLPLLIGLPPLMLPAHVVLTQLVIDPACSLAFEGGPEDPRAMQRPPRRADEGLFGWAGVAIGLVQGGCLLAATLAIDVAAIAAGRDADTARALTVLALTAGNVALVVVNAAGSAGLRVLLGPEGRGVRGMVVAVTAVLALALAWPPARQLLRFGLPAAADMALALALTGAAVALGAWLAPVRR